MTKINVAKERKDAEITGVLHPLVKEWFFSKFKEFSLTQRYGVMNVFITNIEYDKVFKGVIYLIFMAFYNGLERKRVIEIYNFVIDNRRKKYLGQRKLYRLVKENFGVEINETTISGWIFKKIVPFNNEKTQFKPKIKPKKEELYELYINQKQSAEKLGKKYGVSTIIVINWLRFYGISPRTHLESMNTPNVKRELRERKLIKLTKNYCKMSLEKAYILGVLCGDACISKKMIRLEIRKDEEFVSEFARCLREVYGINHNYSYYGKKNTFIMHVSIEEVCGDLLNFGKFGTFEWRVPKKIIESDDEKIIGRFIRGYYDSEGSVSRSTISACSANKEGLNEIAFLLSKLGIQSSLKGLKNGKYFILYIFRKERFKLFKEKIGFTISRKLDNINKTLSTGFFTRRSAAN